MFTNRIIKLRLAIDSIRQKIESLDLPYKEIGYENWDYGTDKPTPIPKCFTFRFKLGLMTLAKLNLRLTL